MTSQSSDGKGNYGWVYAMDYRNNVFTNYWDGNTVGWQGWKRLITDAAFDNITWQNIALKNGAPPEIGRFNMPSGEAAY